jgi:protein TonB
MKKLILFYFLLISTSIIAQSTLKNDFVKHDSIDGIKVLDFIEQMPQFPEGDETFLKYIKDNLILTPINEEVRQSSIYVSFVVDTTGNIRNIYLMNPLFPDKQTTLESKIIEVIKKMPTWKPGELNGKKVPVRYSLPIKIEFL